jgi:amidase
VITVNPTAFVDALRADVARIFGDRRPRLGMPIIVKDNVNTTGMPTTAGSWALARSTPGDAFIVRRLKAAGAIILGKANLSEWANFRSGPSSSGWSGIGDQTNMPYVLDRNPCGSSSGSGVVAAADLAVAAVGTETDGSIVCPSGANGVVGIKPTLGLWSRAGVIPISADQDTAGPMARNVTDAVVLLGAATGVDSDDPATAAQAGNASIDYTRFLNDRALQGAPGRSNRRLARGDVQQAARGLDRRADPRPDDRRAEGAGCDRDRWDRHRPLGDRQRVPGAPMRVQDRHRKVPSDLRTRYAPGHARRVPANPRRVDRLQQGPSPARRPLERRRVRTRRGDERP